VVVDDCQQHCGRTTQTEVAHYIVSVTSTDC